MTAGSIDEVIAQLEAIVLNALSSGDPLGIFALLYLDVTKGVKAVISNGQFEDGVLMERLDVIFANRYLDALAGYQKGEFCTTAWETAFQAVEKRDMIVLQHLLMGMNAHINLDLGIAAAESVPPERLHTLESDFFYINKLLSDKIDEVQAVLGAISPLLFLVDWFGKRKDEKFAEFSLVQARNHAWRTAQRLSRLAPDERAAAIMELDAHVAGLNRFITQPGRMFRWMLRLIKRFEKKDVRMILEVLRG